PARIAKFDRDMRYLVVSHRWATNYRRECEDFIGQSHYDVFPEIPERWKEAHQRGLRGHVVRCDKDRFEHANGSIQWLSWEVLPWYSGGEVGGIIIFSEDITERERVTDEIRRLNTETGAACLRAHGPA